MSAFSESNFVKKLSELNPSQQSIQTLSLWLIHHRKHAKPIVEVWIKELKKVKPPKKLTLLYLANDVLQNSKKKGPEFNKMFRSVMPDAYKFALKEGDPKIKTSMERLVTIWRERGVFDAETVDRIKKSLSKPQSPKASKKSGEDKKKKKKVELTLREEIEIEVKNGGSIQAPESGELVTALQDLESSASSDAAVREKIAALPPEVSDLSKLDKIPDARAAEELSGTVSEAVSMLDSYNGRLAAELQDRRNLAKMLKEYISMQKEGVTESGRRLAEYRAKVQKVTSMRHDLMSHIQSLPDLSLLPSLTGGLAPLPSAGDLFSSDAP